MLNINKKAIDLTKSNINNMYSKDELHQSDVQIEKNLEKGRGKNAKIGWRRFLAVSEATGARNL